MFDKDVAMDQHQMLSYFYRNDVVTVITSDENTQDGDGHWSDVIAVPDKHINGPLTASDLDSFVASSNAKCRRGGLL